MNAEAVSPPPAEEPQPELAAVEAKRVTFDVRRPWPLGLPVASAVLEAIVAQAEVDEPLREAHLRVLSLLPEHLYDAARTSLAGTVDPIGLATASAWRTLIAVDLSSSVPGFDPAALRSLIDEAVDAREKLLAAGYFALDGGASAEELMSALGEAIERLTEKARFRAKTKVLGAHADTRLLAVNAELPAAGAARGSVLRWAFATAFLFSASVHLFNFMSEEAPPSWVVVGNVDRGHAVLAPGSAAADDASRKAAMVELGAKGIKATKSESGEWVLQRSEVTR